ncbi:MAG: sorbosone dehydrogenase [Rhodopila sp.]|jgi:glucose/arabinose dehydrogenase|nr:sorbosone dehydrogenase [Rhodopila sp.]
MKTMLAVSLIAVATVATAEPSANPIRIGQAAFGDWRGDAPGVARQITPDALPAPFASRSAAEMPSVIVRPAGAAPHVPPGFEVAPFATGLEQPRTMRTAPNGDIFVAEVGSDRIRVLRTADGVARPVSMTTFASDVNLPFGIAFWPPGPSPQFVYVGEGDRVVRFPYEAGDLRARGPAQVVVRKLPDGGHWTRDVVFSRDGASMFVAVGSAGNLNQDLTGQPPANLPLGAAWGDDVDRADVLQYTPDGGTPHIFATGLRNCSAEAIQPNSGALWCVVNERDGLGDNLPPDYATQVGPGAFYGWPWFYIGNHPDPRMGGARADLASRVTAPDVLIQAHSAPLGIAFYDGTQFPPEYRGDAFVALHGSWNRSLRTGYKVVRLRFKDGHPTGVYEDFLTGFVASDQAVWARPVGLTMMHDGSLLVSEDGNGTIWRVAYRPIQ